MKRIKHKIQGSKKATISIFDLGCADDQDSSCDESQDPNLAWSNSAINVMPRGLGGGGVHHGMRWGL